MKLWLIHLFKLREEKLVIIFSGKVINILCNIYDW